MSHAIESKGATRIVAVLLGTLSMAFHGARAEDLVIPLELPQFNFVGVGVGAYPDYLGSSDYNLGAAPFGRLSLGGSRFVSLLGNDVRLNLLDNDHWQLGPMGVWRFGREDVENPVVDRVHHIDDSLSLGVFGGYVWRDPKELRRIAGVSAWALGDVSGAYNGWTAGINAYATQPVAKMVTLAGGAASTYGSGNYMDEYFGVTPGDSARQRPAGLPARRRRARPARLGGSRASPESALAPHRRGHVHAPLVRRRGQPARLGRGLEESVDLRGGRPVRLVGTRGRRPASENLAAYGWLGEADQAPRGQSRPLSIARSLAEMNALCGTWSRFAHLAYQIFLMLAQHLIGVGDLPKLFDQVRPLRGVEASVDERGELVIVGRLFPLFLGAGDQLLGLFRRELETFQYRIDDRRLFHRRHGVIHVRHFEKQRSGGTAHRCVWFLGDTGARCHVFIEEGLNAIQHSCSA